MLARVAERMYWFGRYMERAENTARLVDVNGQLTLDLPQAADVVWKFSTDVIDSTELFVSHYGQATERNVVRFMLADVRNPASLATTVKFARENVRSSREVLPSEAWEIVNNLHHFVDEHMQQAITRKNRPAFLDTVIGYSQRMVGLLSGTMSHTEGYRFIQLGRNIERADMTSRIADMGAMELFGHRDRLTEAHDNILWTNVLRAISAYQMFRQFSHDRIIGSDVVDFVFKDLWFPRSVMRCLAVMQQVMAHLPRNTEVEQEMRKTVAQLAKCNIETMDKEAMHVYITDLQLEIAHLHDRIATTWFSYPA
ncbi:MAG: alpha-E domain-containing protein [Gammaproteobacteria bacterium]|nr:alpha-E domain-containing protein [Gammaproteobacteria bacterium]